LKGGKVKGGKKMKQGTNPKPTSPKPKKPGTKIFEYSPKENLEKINKIALKVLEVVEDEGVTEDEFDIIFKLIRNEFNRLKGNRNKNFEFKIKFKEVMLEQFKEAFKKIYDSKAL
jgi:hypothetical protein